MSLKSNPMSPFHFILYHSTVINLINNQPTRNDETKINDNIKNLPKGIATNVATCTPFSYYLTNSREIALTGTKDSNPTFNSSYDTGIYNFPLQGGINRFHPTQKNLKLFEELIKKHSNENNVVLDTFLGSGTTAIACKNTNRKFKGCEISKEYYDKIIQIV